MKSFNPLTSVRSYLVKEINKRLTNYVKGESFKELVKHNCENTFANDKSFRNMCCESVVETSKDQVLESIDDYVNSNINACDIAENFDINDIAGCFNARDIAQQIFTDASEIACHIDCQDVAGYIDTSDVAGHVDVEYSDLADHIEASDVAEHIDVEDCLDYDRIADKLVSKIAQSLQYTS